MDCLADAFRLIYFDQRGRGKSARHAEPARITLQSEIADLEALRVHWHLAQAALLGHSWGETYELPGYDLLLRLTGRKALREFFQAS